MFVLPASGGSSFCGMVIDDYVGICCQLDDAGVLCVSSLELIGATPIMKMCVVLAMDSSRKSSRGPGSFGVVVVVYQCCCGCVGGCAAAEPE